VSAGHSHAHGPVLDPSSARARRITAVVAGVIAVLSVVLVVVFWPGEVENAVGYDPFATDLYDAEVTGAVEAPCQGVPVEGQIEIETRCLTLELTLQSGPDEGETASLNYVEGPGSAGLQEGDQIVVGLSPDAPPEFRYYFADFQRTSPMLVLLIFFIAAVLLLGRFGGLRALLGAGASLVVIVVFLVPALLEGTSPVVVALVGAGLIAVLALYLTHGVNHRTNVAFLGTIASLALTALLAAIFVAATHLTGLVDETVSFVQLGSAEIDVTGLLLAGIVIGALGVIDDVTVTQVSAVWELHATDPNASARQLYRSAITIGRDHIASTVNTLVLAYVGASLPLLLLFQQGRQPLDRILTGEAIATEIVRALVGSIGLIASVPITTALAVAVVGARRGEGGDDPPAEAVDAPIGPAPTPEPEPEPPKPAAWDDFGPEERDF